MSDKRHFEQSRAGYEKAILWIKENGLEDEFNRALEKELSMDGFVVVELANEFRKRVQENPNVG